MTPIEVKKLFRAAVQQNDPQMAWEGVKDLVAQDLYINIPQPQSTEGGCIKIAKWANRPCKCGCGMMIPTGTRVWWVPGGGIYFPEHVGKK